MSDPKAQTAEPTMEEILASIRRIISENDDDGEKKPAEAGAQPAAAPEPEPEPEPEPIPAPIQAAPPPPKPAPEPIQILKSEPVAMAPAPDDVLELTEMVTDDGSVVSLTDNADQVVKFEDYQPKAPEPQVIADDSPEEEAEIVMNTRKPDVEFASNPDMVRPSIEDGLISAASAAAATATFAQLARTMSQDTPAAGNMSLGNADRTLEDLTKELLRPMLKDWLDKNLPPMVEKMVSRELERMARKAEGM